MRLSWSILVVTIFLSACSGKRSGNTPLLPTGAVLLPDTGSLQTTWSAENTIFIHALTEPDNLHPCNGTSSIRSEILQLTQRFLLTNRIGDSLDPDLLGKLPERLPDGKSYRLFLKRGQQWPDKSPITSEDILFTCKVNASGLAENITQLPYWSRLQDAAAATSLEFRLTMDQFRLNDLPFLASIPILQRSFFDPENRLGRYTISELRLVASGERTDSSIKQFFELFNSSGFGHEPTKMVCAGIFSLQEWSPGRFIRLERNLPGKSTGPAGIVYRFNRDDNTVLIGLHDQQYDISTSITSGTFRQALEDPLLTRDYRFALVPSYNYSYLCFNERPDSTKRFPYFTSAAIRKAFAQAVPIDDIIRIVYGDFADRVPRMNSYVSPLKKDYDTTLQMPVGGPTGAETTLKAVGWNDADGDGILDIQVEKGPRQSFEPELLFLNVSPDWRSIAEIIVANMAKSGIRIRPVAVDQATFNQRARSHDFDLLLGSWGGNAWPEDPSQLWSTASWTTNGANYSGFGNAMTDSLIDRMNTTADDTERRSLSMELQKAIAADQPYVFLYNAMRRTIVHRRWSDVLLFPDRPGFLPEEWHLRRTP